MKIKALLCCFSLFLLFACEANESGEMEESEDMDEMEDMDSPDPQMTDSIPSFMDCTFVQIDSTNDGFIDEYERMLMDSCRANQYTSESDAVTGLVGEWVLIGHGEGWFPFPSLPCSQITIQEEQLIFELTSEYQDTISLHTWEVVPTAAEDGFVMNVTPPFPVHVYLRYFSPTHMYGDQTPGDGNMYLYEKVQ